jgi:hypothetical protein
MKPYFVEGKISININVEIEADSLEDAEKKAFELFKDDHPLYYYMESIDENHSLMAGEFDDVDYDEEGEEDENED